MIDAALLVTVFGAVGIGLSLGLFGSGGSILTVPILVYLLHHQDKVAIAESLAVVGAIAAVGAVSFARRGLVDWGSVLFFGLPGMAGTFLGAAVSRWVPGAVQLGLFSVVMLLAAVTMLRQTTRPEGRASGRSRTAAGCVKIAAEGLAVGVLTGLVGVGGGFLIVPALVLLGGLPMSIAVGTSLVIIALKSASGFVKYLDVIEGAVGAVDWVSVGLFIVVGAVGSAAGGRIGRRLDPIVLRRGFAVFLLVMGSFMLFRETSAVLGDTKDQRAPTTSVRADLEPES